MRPANPCDNMYAIGRPPMRSGSSDAPTTATLRGFSRHSSPPRFEEFKPGTSVDMGAGGFHHLAPLRHLGLDEGVEVGRGAPRGARSLAGNPLHDVRLLEYF